MQHQFTRHFLDRLRDRYTLSEVIGQRVQLRRNGREFQGLCPFHKEKTPSFTVNDQKQFYHCFGCGAHGDVVKFVSETENLRWPEAVERLAQEAGMELPQITPQQRERDRRAADLHEVVEQAARWFAAQLQSPEGNGAREYLAQRGIDAETVATFRLGYAPNRRNALSETLTAREIPLPMLDQAGLVARPEDGGAAYDRFRGRIVFPIADGRDRPIAFGGRILPEYDGERIAKYLNSPETPLFHKSEVLYNLSRARRAASDTGHVLVVEGYMDVIALHQAGILQAVAPLGTAVTEQHLRMLWRVSPLVIFCLDGDRAGQAAMRRAAELALGLMTAGKEVRFLALPPGDDPDSFVRRQGKAGFEGFLEQAAPLSQLLWEQLLAEHGDGSPERRASLQAALHRLSERIQDRTVQSQFQSFFRNQLWQLGRGKGRGAKTGAQPRDLQVANIARDSKDCTARKRLEEQLLAILLRHTELYHMLEEPLGRMHFVDQRCETLRNALLQHEGQLDRLSDALQADAGELAARPPLPLPRKLTAEDAVMEAGKVLQGYTLLQMREEREAIEAKWIQTQDDRELQRLMQVKQAIAELERNSGIPW